MQQSAKGQMAQNQTGTVGHALSAFLVSWTFFYGKRDFWLGPQSSGSPDRKWMTQVPWLTFEKWKLEPY